uniref:Gfo/Idh/MocA-like oxidoreductase N-terminal domain-containing protein n=1 Tax=Chromera velia CCMP2878 TaxID=1169474 RepID=A0A0G4GNV0_9ALVE|eukprot:Cvel_22711.t1-p1 / transcript=Cvel_22711.t1 / gene=Cvel_22711 / organism=Chromera_velia_CCMP2878 / gene_product=Uncharacterized oxidoreductase sll0816, putative / transcript_product=Uncharacterized oxidoreductase sll0816, putative / location=Cvel_scaffold2262:22285-24378(-) / protein_length=366 / sequence_SO=supercontig / SO=protein_coding / is_pseudo=false
MTTPRVGIVGTGWGVTVQVPKFRAAGLTIQAIYSRDAKRAEELAKSLDIPEAFTDVSALCQSPNVDLVTVVSPAHLHVPHALLALKSGKSVISEKPMALSVQEATELVEAQKEANVPVAVIGHELRFTPFVQKAKEILESDKLGQIRQITINGLFDIPMFHPPHSHWNDASKGGGIFSAVGVHVVDLLHFLFGFSITRVSAQTLNRVTELPSAEDPGKMIPCDAEDYCNLRLSLENSSKGVTAGTPAQVTLCGCTKGTPRFRAIIGGSSASLVIDIGKSRLILLDKDGDGKLREEVLVEEDEPQSGFPLGTYHMGVALRKFFTDGEKEAMSVGCSLSDGLKVQAVTDAVRASGKQDGDWVSVSYGK